MQPYHSGARRGLSISVALRWPTCARHVPHCQIKTLQALLLRPSLALPMRLMIETLLGSGEKEKTWVQSFSFPLKLLGTKWERVIPNCSMGNCWAKWSLNNHKIIQSCTNIKVIQLKKCYSGHALPKQKNQKTKIHCCSTTVYFPLGRLRNWLDPSLQCLWRFINVPNEDD